MIRAICVVVALLGASVAQAADITVTVSNFTPQEVRAANWQLAKVNANLPVEAQYANAKDYAEHLLQTALASWVVAEAKEAAARQSNDDVVALWQNATDEQRAAAITALKGPEPEPEPEPEP